MKITAKSEYACLAVLALAQHGPGTVPVRIRDIAGTYCIPERYLVQILLQLKGAGLVVSTRGATGGYRLAHEPEAISLSEILTAIDPAGAQGDEIGRDLAVDQLGSGIGVGRCACGRACGAGADDGRTACGAVFAS